MQNQFLIKQASLDEMPFILSLAKQEGWNPGLKDAEPFYAADPHGFFIGELKGEPVGCISAVVYDNDFSFLGLYIVKPEYRHQGFGIQLWNKAINYLEGRTIGLDGVIQQQSNYKKSGFKLFYRHIRFESRTKKQSLSSTLVNLKEISLETLLHYDVAVYGLNRKVFLEKWINMPNAYCLGVLDHNQLVGYGVIRTCVKGYKIGPLFANHNDIAIELYQGLISQTDNQFVFLDVPEINVSAMNLAKHYKMNKVFEAARMYTKEPPCQQLKNIYGVTTLELG